jgi:hypothetical protein
MLSEAQASDQDAQRNEKSAIEHWGKMVKQKGRAVGGAGAPRAPSLLLLEFPRSNPEHSAGTRGEWPPAQSEGGALSPIKSEICIRRPDMLPGFLLRPARAVLSPGKNSMLTAAYVLMQGDGRARATNAVFFSALMTPQKFLLIQIVQPFNVLRLRSA